MDKYSLLKVYENIPPWIIEKIDGVEEVYGSVGGYYRVYCDPDKIEMVKEAIENDQKTLERD